MNRMRAPMRMAALAYMRPASRVRPTMAATVKAIARPICQAGTSPPEVRTTMRMGANGGSREDLSSVCSQDAEHDAHRGGLAGPVAPDEAEDLPRPDLEAQVVDGDRVAIPLRDARDLEGRFVGHRWSGGLGARGVGSGQSLREAVRSGFLGHGLSMMGMDWPSRAVSPAPGLSKANAFMGCPRAMPTRQPAVHSRQSSSARVIRTAALASGA
jgi:hypothetical protein